MNAARLRSWLPLLLALAVIALGRWPLVENAAAHLDSDLAVDGLTLADALRGHWRWHYPGTPAIGALPVLASLPFAWIGGANPRTLVAGGVVLYALTAMATYLLNRRAYGPPVAAWGLVPLAFASTGLVWLSGRITGGHWLVAAWSAGALALFHHCLRREGPIAAGWLGLWCGLGLYVDRMFLLTLVSIATAAVLNLVPRPSGAARRDAVLAFLVGGLIGWLPHGLGAWLDPHDAYGEPFVSIFRPIGENRAVLGLAWEQAGTLLIEHGRILGAECLPRLVAGHRVPGWATDPPTTIVAPLAAAWSLAAAAGFLAAVAALGLAAFRRDPTDPRRTVARAQLWLAAAVIAGFLFNRNIFDSDNYRYLVLLVIPGSSGFGLAMQRLATKGGRSLALAAAGLFALLSTADTAAWYRGLGWIEGLRPVVARPKRDPALAWLSAHPEVREIHGRYWEVYRLAFLAGRAMRAVPWPDEPQRFPREPSPLAVDHPTVGLLVGGHRLTAAQVEEIRQHHDEELLRQPGLTVFRWR